MVTNCGGYYLNLAYTKDNFDSISDPDYLNSNENLALLCAYCLPGFEAVFKDNSND